MKGTKNFIIQLDKAYNETFKTEGGLELYGNVDFTTERQSNRIAKVMGVPHLYKTDIKDGYEVLIDASPIYRQIYEGSKQWYQNVVNEKENLFYLSKDMIICYRENDKSEWVGFLDNCLVKPIMEEEKEIKTSLVLPETVTSKKFTGKISMTYANRDLKELGVENGQTLHMNPLGGVKYWFEGIEYWWVRTKDIFAIQLA